MRQRLLGTTIIGGLMLAIASPVAAQSQQLPGVSVQTQSDEDATEIDEVVVTGSRIRRDPTNAPTPLIQITGEQLLTTGQSTVIDYLATMPALSSSLVPSDTTGSGLNDGGLSLANLRSLGTGRTLTLVDGRRHVGAGQGSLAVDVDSIPRLLIQNIEVVTGGASSVYGADAVSGVLNFILRRDFEGLEIDANYGMINQDGQANKRFSALIGTNLLDDRLNLYAFAEYEDIDEVQSLDIDWLLDSRALVGIDADPTSAVNDGMFDQAVFHNLRTLSRPRWGQTTLANAQQPSPLNDPDVPLADCTAVNSANCYGLDPTRTYVYEGSTARLANFGQRVGTVGTNRTLNVGGDGENPSAFGTGSRVPSSTSTRYQVGANFAVLDNVDLSVEYKMVEEDTFDISQPTFFDIFLHDTAGTSAGNPTWTNRIRAVSQFDLRYTDNAYLPQNVKDAITANMVQNWTANANTPGTPSGAAANRRWARHSLFGPDRSQDNHREVERYVVAFGGDFDQIGFITNIDWDLSYTFGEATNKNVERGVDVQRFALAADAVVDTAGVVNGRPGEIVCRARRIERSGVGDLDDYARNVFGGRTAYNTNAEFKSAVDNCVPLNVFGNGNQSQAALDYVDAAIFVTHVNEQEQAIASISGQLWDFWGAGAIGVALGAEHRREFTEGLGRTRSSGDRLLFLNTGADFAAAEYESDEWFAELSIPLFNDSWLGEYAELSGSYRSFDYTTAGSGDVYGVNLVYRPIQDITFKTSLNTSFRAPSLSENFSPFNQTFANGLVEPCSTADIALQNAQIRTNRITNCQSLLNAYNAANGTALAFDFAGATASNLDDFRVPGNDGRTYNTGIAGVLGGNPGLDPEESESFTFSTVLEPRFIPNLTLVLDYYEIEIQNVISAPGAVQIAANCVNGSTLDPVACGLIVRRNTTTPFGIGAPAGDPIGGFIQQPLNYAALKTRGLDFQAIYSLDTEEVFGRNWGRFDYRVGGLWLIEQKQFLNLANPGEFTELASSVTLPRVRLTSSLTWTPNDIWSVNWTVDWQSAQDIALYRDQVGTGNIDLRPIDTYDTGNFARHDFTVRWNAADDLSVRMGVVNAFDAEQKDYLGNALFSNFDPYGTRFFIGLNYRPF